MFEPSEEVGKQSSELRTNTLVETCVVSFCVARSTLVQSCVVCSRGPVFCSVVGRNLVLCSVI